MEKENEEFLYQEAVKKVKRIKGFYIHLMVYVLVNIFIIIAKALNLDPGEKFWNWDLVALPLVWGIGLTAHGLSVLVQSNIFGRDWEERKIREIIDKNKQK